MVGWCAGATSRSTPAATPSRRGGRWKRNSGVRDRLLVIASASAWTRSERLDCFVAEPVIGRAFARPVGSSQWRVSWSVRDLLLAAAHLGGELVVIFCHQIDIALVLEGGRRRLQGIVEVGERVLLVLRRHLVVGLDLGNLRLDD